MPHQRHGHVHVELISFPGNRAATTRAPRRDGTAVAYGVACCACRRAASSASTTIHPLLRVRPGTRLVFMVIIPIKVGGVAPRAAVTALGPICGPRNRPAVRVTASALFRS